MTIEERASFPHNGHVPIIRYLEHKHICSKL